MLRKFLNKCLYSKSQYKNMSHKSQYNLYTKIMGLQNKFNYHYRKYNRINLQLHRLYHLNLHQNNLNNSHSWQNTQMLFNKLPHQNQNTIEEY